MSIHCVHEEFRDTRFLLKFKFGGWENIPVTYQHVFRRIELGELHLLVKSIIKQWIST